MERLEAKYYDRLRNSITMNNLKKLIDAKGYTIVKVANESKISDSTLYNYIKSQRMPSIITLIELANNLNCNIDYLLDRTDNPININDIDKLDSTEINHLIHNILSLPKEKQELVEAYVKGLLNK